MNRILLIAFILISIESTTTFFQSNQSSEIETDVIDTKAYDYPFSILFQAKEYNDNEYKIDVTIRLEGDSYIISPFSEDDTYGHFNFDFPKNDKFTVEGELLETPNSVEEFDPVIEAPVRFVRENTTYQKTIKVKSKEDFEVTGLIEFLLEPSCIPYDVEFLVSYHSGEMKVQHIKTYISKEYKGK